MSLSKWEMLVVGSILIIANRLSSVGCCCFFFQAEDGIRDAQESRGLGDVYKRQVPGSIAISLPTCKLPCPTSTPLINIE